MELGFVVSPWEQWSEAGCFQVLVSLIPKLTPGCVLLAVGRTWLVWRCLLVGTRLLLPLVSCRNDPV